MEESMSVETIILATCTYNSFRAGTLTKTWSSIVAISLLLRSLKIENETNHDH